MRGTASCGFVIRLSGLFFPPKKPLGSELEVWQVSVLSGRGGDKIRSRVWEKSKPEPSQHVICRLAALVGKWRPSTSALLAYPVLPSVLCG